MLATDLEYAKIAEVGGELGWAHLRSLSDLKEHRLLGHLDAAATRITASPQPRENATKAIDKARDLGVGAIADIDAWESWIKAEGESLQCSSAWQTAVLRWCFWRAESNT